MKTRKMKCAALLASGGMVSSFGCIPLPDNFWADTWGGMIQTAVDTTVQAYILDPFVDFIEAPED